MKKRRIEPNIEKFIKHDNAIVLTGARRVGKTSLLKNIFKKIESESKLWFDLDNPLHQKVFEGLDYNDVYKELIDI
jgi:predicted AAA+ superfamily ATPase